MGGKPSCMRRRDRDVRRSASFSGYRGCGCRGLPPPAGPPGPLQRSTTMSGPWGRRCQRGSLSPEELAKELDRCGLLPAKLIFGIDFTKSNEWTGKSSFQGRNLHDISVSRNPYEEVIASVGRALSSTDYFNSIKLYGFGDASSKDKEVFGFHKQNLRIQSFDEALDCYREIVPQVKMAGPTSFAPIIDMAMSDVCQSGGQYHILIIIADGQITRCPIPEGNELSLQEKETLDALIRTRTYPLSIFLVGVGDQIYLNSINKFMNCIPRGVNNLEFVNFTEITSKKAPQICKDLELARILMEKTLEQYQEFLNLNVIWDPSRRKRHARVPLPPPSDSLNPRLYEPTPPPTLTPEQTCTICFCNPKDMVFGCGHQTCCICATSLASCPICRCPIQTRIKLFLDS